jgi:hypothetical protein
MISDSATKLWQALATLAPREQQLLVRVALEQQPHADLANLYGVSIPALQVNIARALAHYEHALKRSILPEGDNVTKGVGPAVHDIVNPRAASQNQAQVKAFEHGEFSSTPALEALRALAAQSDWRKAWAAVEQPDDLPERSLRNERLRQGAVWLLIVVSTVLFFLNDPIAQRLLDWIRSLGSRQ